MDKEDCFLTHTPPQAQAIFVFSSRQDRAEELGKVVMSAFTLTTFSLETLIEHVKNLESLEVVVDGDFVENYSSLLTLGPIVVKEKAKALGVALGSRCFLKHPILLGVKAEDVAKRVANLQAKLSEDLARQFLDEYPMILFSRETTLQELWLNLTEMFPGSELMTRIKIRPSILSLNWKSLNSEFEYLVSQGFTKGKMLSALSMISGRSLEKWIKPHVEQALRRYRS